MRLAVSESTRPTSRSYVSHDHPPLGSGDDCGALAPPDTGAGRVTGCALGGGVAVGDSGAGQGVGDGVGDATGGEVGVGVGRGAGTPPGSYGPAPGG